MVEPSGENSILIIKGANNDLLPADVERAAADLKTCDLILLQLEVPLETVYAALAFGKAHDVATLLNPAPATPDLDRRKVGDASFFVPNETELAILTGMPVETERTIADAARSSDRAGRGHRHRHDGCARRAVGHTDADRAHRADRREGDRHHWRG